MLVGMEKQERFFFRLPVKLEVKYKFVPDGVITSRDKGLMQGTTENLSGGGLLLRGEEPPVEIIGDLLSGRMGVAVSLSLPGGEAKALARVAWVEGVGRIGSDVYMGLKFQEITDHTRDRIIQFLLDSFLPTE